MESKSFSSRGIQQEDVWLAADSLIADGLRPTIERVRQKIGRGSPNTVSPMLESWFATLASRLGVNNNKDAPDNLPKVLQQALESAWEVALSKGREASALEIVQIQDTLKQATVALSKRQTEFDQMERVRVVKHQALQESVDSAKSIADDALSRLSETQRLVSRREKEIHDLQDKLVAVETAWNGDKYRNQEMTAEYLQERNKVEERAQSMQHRLLEEIDRARQETKKIAIEIETIRKRFTAENIRLEEKNQSQGKEQSRILSLYTSQSDDLHTLREKFSTSNSLSNEMEVLLRAQLEESKSVVSRLTEAFLGRDDGSVSRSRSQSPKFKKIRSIRKK